MPEAAEYLVVAHNVGFTFCAFLLNIHICKMLTHCVIDEVLILIYMVTPFRTAATFWILVGRTALLMLFNFFFCLSCDLL